MSASSKSGISFFGFNTFLNFFLAFFSAG